MHNKTRISPSLLLYTIGTLLFILGGIAGIMLFLDWVCPALTIWVAGALMGGFLVMILFTEKVMPEWEKQIEQEVETRRKNNAK